MFIPNSDKTTVNQWNMRGLSPTVQARMSGAGNVPVATTLEDAMKCINPGDKVYLTGNDGQLPQIHRALYEHALELNCGKAPIGVLQLLARDTILCRQEMVGKVQCITPFPGGGTRKGYLNINNGGVDVVPIHLSEIATYFEERFRPSVVVVHTSAPKDGILHLAEGGIAIHAVWTCKKNGGTVIAVVNDQYPFMAGNCQIAVADADFIVNISTPPLTHPQAKTQEWEYAIARNIASLLKDGDIIQLGIGNIPKMVLRVIKELGLKNISIFSEVLEVNKDLRELIEAGIITGTGLTGGHYGKMVCGILLAASQEDYEWLRDPENGKLFDVEPQAYVNAEETMQVVKLPGHRLVSVNAALAATVRGDVSAHTFATTMGETMDQSAWGGALNFCLGADVSIIAFSATRMLNGSIVDNVYAVFPQGTTTTYPGVDTDCLVTQYGIARIKHTSYAERFQQIIGLVPVERRSMVAWEVRKHIPGLAHLADEYLQYAIAA